MGRGPVSTPPGARDSAPSHRKTFRRDIQGIRALGLALVFLTHAKVGAVSGGFVGLDAFFVISGFLITGLIVDEIERSGALSLLRFYARRIRRLLPLAVLVLVVVVVGSALMFSPVRNDTVAGDVVAASFYFVNWRFAAQSVDYFAPEALESPLQHFWSLSVEEQYYLVWPTLLLLALIVSRRRGRGSLRQWLWLAVLATGLPSLYYSALVVDTQTASYSYFSTLTRVWEFSLGGALALALPRRLELPGVAVALLSWLGVGVLVATAFVFTPEIPYPGSAALLPTLATAAIVVAGTATAAAWPTRLLSSRPCQYVGDLSYAWYLWHWPALIFAWAAWGELTPLQNLAIIAASWIPAELSHRYVEQPLRYSRPLARQPRRALGLGLASMVLAVALAVSLTAVQTTVPTASADQVTGAAAAEAGDPLQRRAAALRPAPIDAKDDRGEAYRAGCLVDQGDRDSPPCVLANRASERRIVLFGNSHALHYAPALLRLAKRHDWRMTALMRAGCPIADVEFGPRCDDWRRRTLDRIATAERPDLIVVATSTQFKLGVVADGERLTTEDSLPLLEAGLVRTLARLRETGAPVVLLKDLPRAPEDVPECVARDPGDLERCAFRDERGDGQHYDARAAAAVDGVRSIDVAPLLCPEGVCPAVIGNALVYRDDNHLTATFARTLAPWLGRRLPELRDSG